MAKKRKPCPNCLRIRWLLLYLGCAGLLAALFINEFLNKGF